jgi:hypothetical protein
MQPRGIAHRLQSQSSTYATKALEGATASILHNPAGSAGTWNWNQERPNQGSGTSDSTSALGATDGAFVAGLEKTFGWSPFPRENK